MLVQSVIQLTPCSLNLLGWVNCRVPDRRPVIFARFQFEFVPQ